MQDVSAVETERHWRWVLERISQECALALCIVAASACEDFACPEGYTHAYDQCVRREPACGEDSGACPPGADAAAPDPCEADATSSDCQGARLLAVRSFGADDGSELNREQPNRGMDLTIDDQGNVYMVGQFSGSTRFGDIQLTSQGMMDGFVAKLDENLEPIWATATLATPGKDAARFVAVDSHHEVWALSCTIIEPSTTPLLSQYTVELQKYAEDGSLKLRIPFEVRNSVWSHEGQMLIVDSDDNAYLALEFLGQTAIAGQTLTTADPIGGIETLLAKFGPDGDLHWIETYAATPYATAANLTLVHRGADESLLMSGGYVGTFSRGVPSPGTASPTSTDAFVLELDMNGQALHLTTDDDDAMLDGWDSVKGAALTEDGRLVVAALTMRNFPYQETVDSWLGVYDAERVALSEKSAYRLPGENSFQGMVPLTDGRFAIAGSLSGLTRLGDSTQQPLDPAKPDVLVAIWRDRGDHLELQSSRTFGGPGLDRAVGIAQGPSGAVYVSGWINGQVRMGEEEVGLADLDSILLMKLSP